MKNKFYNTTCSCIRVFIILMILIFAFKNKISAQTINISGLVKNTSDSKPIPYASVKIEGSNFSTSANSEGYFTFKFPDELKNYTIIISSLGFESRKIKITQASTQEVLSVSLAPSSISLSEINISNESAAQIVATAYTKIPANYPQDNTFYTGFYRESSLYTGSDSVENYNYVIEAIIKMNKPSNTKKAHTDDIKIIQSKKKVFPLADSTLKWFGGAYTPIRFDVVRQNFEFINPKETRKYTYQKEDYTTYYDEPVHVISFKPKDSGRYLGKLYINAKTYAIVKADFQFSSAGLREKNMLRVGNFKNRVFRVNYQPIGGLWYLQSVWQQAVGEFNRQNFRYLTEYATTVIDTGHFERFEYGEKLDYGEVLSAKEIPYNKDFWESFNIVSETRKLRELLIDTAKTNQPLLIVNGKKVDRRQRVNQIRGHLQQKLRRIFIIPSIDYLTTTNPILVNYKTQNEEILNEVLTKESIPLSIGFGFGLSYAINRNTFIKMANLSEVGYFNSNIVDLGVNYQTNLSAAMKRPLRLVVGLDYTTNNIKRELAKHFLQDELRLSNKRFENNIKIDLISKLQALKPNIGINWDLNKVLTTFLEGSYIINFYQRDYLKFTELSDNLFKKAFPKSVQQNLFSPETTITMNNSQISKIPYVNQFSFRFGFRGFIRLRH